MDQEGGNIPHQFIHRLYRITSLSSATSSTTAQRSVLRLTFSLSSSKPTTFLTRELFLHSPLELIYLIPPSHPPFSLSLLLIHHAPSHLDVACRHAPSQEAPWSRRFDCLHGGQCCSHRNRCRPYCLPSVSRFIIVLSIFLFFTDKCESLVGGIAAKRLKSRDRPNTKFPNYPIPVPRPHHPHTRKTTGNR